jgi:hypothetical protein
LEILSDVLGRPVLRIGFRVLEIALEVAGRFDVFTLGPPPIQFLERGPIHLSLIATRERFEVLPNSGRETHRQQL